MKLSPPRNIGARIELLRGAFGLKPGEMAERAKIKLNALSNYRAGIRRPDLEQADRLVEAFDVTLDFIYYGSFAGLPVSVYERLKAYEQEQRAKGEGGLKEQEPPKQKQGKPPDSASGGRFPRATDGRKKAGAKG